MRKLYFCVAVLTLTYVGYSCKKSTRNVDDTTVPKPEIPKTAFKTLNYLYEISGKKTISGIHNKEPNSTPLRWTNQINATTGKFPALWSGDFLFLGDDINNRQVMVDEAVNQWKKGALINIMWHACNPSGAQPCIFEGGVKSTLTDQQWTELLTEGTAINIRWKAMMDEVSVYLKQLKDKGVEVLWRPLHEMNQPAFWWAGRPGANGTRKLWQYTHDYMVKTKGLTNLIWIWDLQDFSSLSNDVTSYNPGEGYWDVLALDIYEGYSIEKYTTILSAAKGKPIAIGECDLLPTREILLGQPKWTFFMGWSEDVYKKNTDLQIQNIFNAMNVITLGQMPGW